MRNMDVDEQIEVINAMVATDDFANAREKLRKLELEHPTIDNIAGMVAACDVLHSASFEVLSGEIDWYWVLQVSQTSSQHEIESRYSKLVKLLSPITDTPSAEAALKIVQNAYSILSNPVNRSAFDKRRQMKLETYDIGKPQKIHVTDYENRNQSSYVFLTSSKAQVASEKNNVGGSNDIQAGDGNHFSAVESSDFSTFMKKTAKEGIEKTSSDTNFSLSASLHTVEGCSKSMTSVSMVNCAQESHNFVAIRNPEDFEVGQVWAIYDHENLPRSYVQIESIDKGPIRLHVNKLKLAPVVAQEIVWSRLRWPVVCGLFYVDASETLSIGPAMLSHIICDFAGKEVEIYPRTREVWAICRDWEPGKYCSDPEVEKYSPLEVVEIVSGYSKEEDIIVARLTKVKGFDSVFRRYTEKGFDHLLSVPVAHISLFSHSILAEIIVGGELDGMLDLDPYAVPEILASHATIENIPSDAGNAALWNSKWSPKDFTSDQVWAVYDGSDGMPRTYVVVNNVASETEICVTVLEPLPSLDFQTHWVAQDLPIVCGLFKVGSITTNLGLSQFSHRVDVKPEEGKYAIYPGTGEVWAVYRNWSCTRESSDLTAYTCQIVEIVADFTNGPTLTVANLVEVPGCTTFFQRELHDGFELFREVPQTKLITFSHQIAAYRVPAVKELGVPEGSWHLEPDALPLPVPPRN